MRTSLASRTRFEVLGLKTNKSSKTLCPRSRTVLFFDLLKMGEGHDLFFGLKFCVEFAIFCAKTFFLEHLRVVSLASASSIPVLGLERVCPRKVGSWPWPRIFFVSLAFASSLVSSTPPLQFKITKLYQALPR